MEALNTWILQRSVVQLQMEGVGVSDHRSLRRCPTHTALEKMARKMLQSAQIYQQICGVLRGGGGGGGGGRPDKSILLRASLPSRPQLYIPVSPRMQDLKLVWLG